MKPILASLCCSLALGGLGAPAWSQGIASTPMTTTTMIGADTGAGSVRRTQDGLCMEPGHPLYATETVIATHTNMRLCIAAGGRRDGPRDTITDTPVPTVPSDTPAPNLGITPPMGSLSAITQGPVASDVPLTQGLGLDEDGIGAPPAPPRPPRGIALPETPSYSENPTIFRPPEAYVGRGPQDFLP